jgi:23S rRNA (guanosine2251-2'-O)-methyltransferase
VERESRDRRELGSRDREQAETRDPEGLEGRAPEEQETRDDERAAGLQAGGGEGGGLQAGGGEGGGLQAEGGEGGGLQAEGGEGDGLQAEGGDGGGFQAEGGEGGGFQAEGGDGDGLQAEGGDGGGLQAEGGDGEGLQAEGGDGGGDDALEDQDGEAPFAWSIGENAILNAPGTYLMPGTGRFHKPVKLDPDGTGFSRVPSRAGAAPGAEAASPPGGGDRPNGYGTASEVVGVNAVAEALEARGDTLRRLYLSSTRRPSAPVKALMDKAASLGSPPRKVPPSFFARFAPRAHQGICAVFDELAPLDLEDFLDALPPEGPSLVLALDHIEDPGNLGAVMRSAWAFGAHGAVAPRDRSAGITPAAAKAAAGGLERVPFARAVNLTNALKLLKKKGYWIVGAEASGGSELASFDFPERSALVLGGEGRGLGRLVSEAADFLVKIPLADGAESLNVSSAAAVFMYAYRTRFPLA